MRRALKTYGAMAFGLALLAGLVGSLGAALWTGEWRYLAITLLCGTWLAWSTGRL